ncbi:MAG TPA: dTMP kinase [Bacteroidia bacterium]|nr:dTMP kinase [Bacteroidia bacterium]HRH08445.1 dTMP kinase [Bacteroidia bacterium]
MKKIQNRVIALEGFDGSGKSTIAKWIAEKYGYEFQKSPSENFANEREVFDMPNTGMRERLAFYMGDCLRLSMLLREDPKKKYVLDRYYYSTIAYHEARRKGVTSQLKKIYRTFYKPDLIILVKSDFETIQRRIKLRKEKAANDSLFLSKKLFNKIYVNYQNIIDTRCIVIDNNEDLKLVFKKIDKFLK